MCAYVVPEASTGLAVSVKLKVSGSACFGTTTWKPALMLNVGGFEISMSTDSGPTEVTFGPNRILRTVSISAFLEDSTTSPYRVVRWQQDAKIKTEAFDESNAKDKSSCVDMGDYVQRRNAINRSHKLDSCAGQQNSKTKLEIIFLAFDNRVIELVDESCRSTVGVTCQQRNLPHRKIKE